VPEVEEPPNRSSRRRARKRKSSAQADSDPPTLQPPPDSRPGNPLDRPPDISDEQFEEFKKNNPTMLDKANTQTDVT
jgi:hypothetical protein